MSQLQYQLLQYPDNTIEKEQLKIILKDLRQLNEINKDLSLLLNQQEDQLLKIEEHQQETIDITDKSVEYLEKAIRSKTKLIPIAIGSVVGAAVCGPGALVLGVKAGVGYIAAGGGIIGGIAAKKMS